MTNEAMTTEFAHNGLDCKIYLTGMGHHCGYVAVGLDHPWFGRGYNDEVPVPDDVMNREVSAESVGVINLFTASLHQSAIELGKLPICLAIDVHGGLTFAGEHKGSDLWWFGFDCCHTGDGMRQGDPDWKDADYVAAQCRRLADQLIAVPSPNHTKEG